MEILQNEFSPVMDRWDDPGDYPSGAGSGPLPSEDFVAEIEGSMVIQLEVEDEFDLETVVTNCGVPDGIKVTNWNYSILPGHRIVITVNEFEVTEPNKFVKDESGYNESDYPPW